ncbi:hypothetical protein EYC84_010778 [Monilinia fructicola]|uniref:Uncharacterized protein n=1 Tax=Monilinia fructicola TaxID=38448 RepID=A0A5M9J8Z6_MONFR|nr:hypothetical protein EYC84_010778 [Monilinia fructicola]
MAETPNPITQTRNPHEMDTLGHAKTHAIAAMSGLAISARVGSLQDFVRPTYSSAHAGCSTHARTRSAHGSSCMKFPGAPSNDLRARDLGAASMSIQAHEGSRRRGGGSGSGAGMDRRGEMDVSGGVAVGGWVGGGSPSSFWFLSYHIIHCSLLSALCSPLPFLLIPISSSSPVPCHIYRIQYIQSHITLEIRVGSLFTPDSSIHPFIHYLQSSFIFRLSSFIVLPCRYLKSIHLKCDVLICFEIQFQQN